MERLTTKQIAMLESPLDKATVSTREQGGKTLSYIEGWHAIAEANRIFGFDAWSRETIYCKEICRYDYKDKFGGTKNKVGYEAKVRITVGGVSREGTGTGSGIAGDLYDAIEGANKEAETDAMKRALMTFGNPFGLALYDKQQRNVESAEDREREEKERQEFMRNFVIIPQCSTGEDWEAYTDSMARVIQKIKTFKELTDIRNANQENLDKLNVANSELRDQLSEIFRVKAASMKAPPKPPAPEERVH